MSGLLLNGLQGRSRRGWCGRAAEVPRAEHRGRGFGRADAFCRGLRDIAAKACPHRPDREDTRDRRSRRSGRRAMPARSSRRRRKKPEFGATPMKGKTPEQAISNARPSRTLRSASAGHAHRRGCRSTSLSQTKLDVFLGGEPVDIFALGPRARCGRPCARAGRWSVSVRASCSAPSPPPMTATSSPRKKPPSQVAQCDTPRPASSHSPGTPSLRTEAPVATMIAPGRWSGPPRRSASGPRRPRPARHRARRPAAADSRIASSRPIATSCPEWCRGRAGRRLADRGDLAAIDAAALEQRDQPAEPGGVSARRKGRPCRRRSRRSRRGS